MYLTIDVLRDLLGTIAILALLAVGYGAIMRRAELIVAQTILGGLFGGTAVLALQAPIVLAPGLIVDMRLLPVVLAGAFLGWPGAAVTFGMGAAMRIGIGGTGMVCGVAAMAVSVLIGLGWAWRCAQRQQDDKRLTTILGPMSLLAHGCIVLLPADLAWRVVATWPFFMPAQVVGIFVVGRLLERERRLLRTERHLAKTANRDQFTGLLNRRGFEAAVVQARPQFTGSALLLLDLDHFKRVNDVHGHDAGDAVLQELAGRLECALEGGRGILGRLGGEEFAVFLPSTLPRDARQVAERLRCEVSDGPFALPGGLDLAVTVSVGGAWCPDPAELDTLLKRADLALYAAKGSGRDCCCLHVHQRDVPAPASIGASPASMGAIVA